MEQIRVFWGVNLFFFALILLFIWSKIIIISKKIDRIRGIATLTEQLIKENIALEKKESTATEEQNKRQKQE